MIQVVCWKWNNGLHPRKQIYFSADHVNRLFSMVKANTSVDFEPVCITDDPTGIDPHIRIIPLWDDARELGGCYTRLKAFSEEMKTIIGPRFIWIDLDAVITGNIDHILQDKREFVMWGDTNRTTPYNGSMCLMTAGCRKQVWETFNPATSPKQGKLHGFVGTDQAWIGIVLGQNEAKWSNLDGVYSYRLYFEKGGKSELPENARIVFFHGRTDPSMAHIRQKHPWIERYWR